jgi:hypothetical protein
MEELVEEAEKETSMSELKEYAKKAAEQLQAKYSNSPKIEGESVSDEEPKKEPEIKKTNKEELKDFFFKIEDVDCECGAKFTQLPDVHSEYCKLYKK